MRKIVFDDVDFADSEFSSLELSEKTNSMRLTLIAWDEKKLEIILNNPIQFSYKLGSVVSNFYQFSDESMMLREALSKCYEKQPLNHPYVLFQLVDIEDFPFIEVVAQSATLIKGIDVVGFDK